MPKYWGKQIFSHGSFPEVGEKHTSRLDQKEWKLLCNNETKLYTLSELFSF